MPNGNGIDPEVLRPIVEKIESVFADLLSERGAYMNRCRGIRQGLTVAYEEAKAAGIPKKELRLKIKNMGLQRKMRDSIAELEADERQNYQMIEDALGDFADLPLGQAAVARAKGETLDSLNDRA